MALNLGMLGFFKYYNFFAESLHAALARAGLSISLWHLEVALPIGISFYTFQSMSYVIDVYRREIPPTRNLVQFAAFVSFFPHLVAGPDHAADHAAAAGRHSRGDSTSSSSTRGAYLIFWGLLKKVVIADNLAAIVNDLFGRWQTLDGGSALLAVYAFAFQIYGDFSGYTDIARGVSKCLGFELSLNFNLPYFATSPRDFWNRWHISLSQWLRDYLYISLGGNRGGTLRTYRNLMLTMILGGLWHGAAWTFVLWGVYHGLLLVGAPARRALAEADRPARPGRPRLLEGPADRRDLPPGVPRLADLPRRIGRAGRSACSRRSCTGPRSRRPPTSSRSSSSVIPLLIVQLIQYLADDLDVIARTPWYVRSVFYTACFYAIVLGANFGGQQFIYFQF